MYVYVSHSLHASRLELEASNLLYESEWVHIIWTMEILHRLAASIEALQALTVTIITRCTSSIEALQALTATIIT